MATVTYHGRVDGAQSDSVDVGDYEYRLEVPQSNVPPEAVDQLHDLTDTFSFSVVDSDEPVAAPPPEPPPEPELPGSDPENQ